MTPLLTYRKTKTKIDRRELADAVGIDYTHLTRIELGTQIPSAAVAKKIADYLDNKVTRDQILFPELYPNVGKKPSRSVRPEESMQGAR